MIHLSQAELRRMIGTDVQADQIAWLTERGWPYVINWAGQLIVGRDAAAQCLANPKPATQRKANLAAVR